jgi:hypothetical protein
VTSPDAAVAIYVALILAILFVAVLRHRGLW